MEYYLHNMEQNFLFIWTYILKIVQYYFEQNKPEEAYKVFENGCNLVAGHLPKAYSIATKTLTREQIDTIWKFDGECNENN